MKRFHILLVALSLLLGGTLFSESSEAHDFGGYTTVGAPEDLQPDDPCKKMLCSCGSGSGNSVMQSDGVGKPVMLLDGGENYAATDLSLGDNFPIRLQRKYDSQSTYDSPLGYGWAFFHDRRIFEYPDGSSVLRRGCGNRAVFQFTAGAYVTDRDSVQGELTRLPDGSYTFRYYNGYMDYFDAEGRLTIAKNPDGWQHEFLYTSDKKPLVGTSEFSVNPDQALTAAYVYQLIRIQQRSPDGQLTGYALDLSYHATSGRLTQIIASDGRVLNYQHDSFAGATRGNLIQVSGLDNLSMHYDYQDPNDHHNLTHIQDTTTATPYVNTYDSQDRVITQTHGEQVLTFAYPQPRAVGTVTRTIKDDQGVVVHTAVTTYEFDEAGYLTKVIDALGNEARHSYSSNKDRIRTEVWLNGGSGLALQKTTEWTHDTLGNITAETVTLDSGETITRSWTYDHGRVSSQQAVSSAAPSQVFRTETSYYHDAQNIPLRIHEVKQINGAGADRVTTYTYCDVAEIGQVGSTCPFEGLIKTIDGPRDDVNDLTSFTYYASSDTTGCAANGPCHLKGQLHTTTNALGQVFSALRYTPAGDLAQSQDPNGLITDYEYHERRWVTAIKVRGNNPNSESDDLITLSQYDAAGNLIQRSEPDGSSVSFSYDGRHRLTQLSDNLNNQIRYTLDSEGNRLQEDSYDASATLKRRVGSRYDALNRQSQQLTAAGEVTAFSYDASNNLLSMLDPITGTSPTQNLYDDLDRLRQSTDPASGITQYAYDANNNLTQVTDPNGNATTYTYNELGDQVTLSSPDTGVSQYEYDLAGNRTQQIDARGVVANYSYDALNRLSAISYPSDSSLNISFTYDQGSNGLGRLTAMSDGSGSSSRSYDQLGRVTGKAQIVGSVTLSLQYQYDADGHLASMTYPDNSVLSYSYDSVGRLAGASITLPGGSPQALINDADYLPFGPISHLDYAGNFPDQDRNYDLDYRPTGLSGPLARTYTTDPVGNITAISQGGDTWHYDYDNLYRLLGVEQPLNTSLQSYSYDANGNRTSKNGTAYQIATNSNRILQTGNDAFSYDAMGNKTAMPNGVSDSLTLTYGAHQRLVNLSNSNGASGEYTYNGRGERVKKLFQASPTDPQSAIVFLYDEAGQLQGEYDVNGVPISQYLWLGNQVLGLIRSGAVYAIHIDHLTTPRAVVDSNGTTLWRWDSEAMPFGEALANLDPDGDSVEFDLKLRFPGQYYDLESGQHYNYFRFYTSSVGKYIEPDPLGLVDGNIYLYASANPIGYIDSKGLTAMALPRPIIMPRPLPIQPYDPILPFPELVPLPGGTPKDPFGEYCRSLARRIANSRDEIYNKRYPDLETNPKELPYRIGPKEKLKETVRGHEKLLNRKLRELRDVEDEYARNCAPIACL